MYFSYFRMETHVDCSNDYLELRETNVNGRLLGRYCGNQSPSNLTALNGLWMKLRSDSAGTFQGFMGEFNTGLSLH